MKRLVLVIFIIIQMVAPALLAAPKWLKNDGFDSGGTAYYQQGFIANEIMASVFVPDAGDYPAKLLKVHTLVQDGTPGGGTIGAFVLYIWQDIGGVNPGTLLFTESYQLTAADAFNEVDLSPYNIIINSGNIRVGWEHVLNPPPSFCRDADGTITPHRNLIYGNFGMGWEWRWSENVGLLGDWIHRLQIDTNYGGPTATPNPPTVTPTPEPTFTWTPEPTETPTIVPTNTPPSTHTPTVTPTETPTGEPSPGTPTATPPTATPTQEPTITPTTAPPTQTPEPTVTATCTPSPTLTSTPTPVPPTPTPDDGIIYWDSDVYYGPDARGVITVEDSDLNTDPMAQETVDVHVWSQQTDPYPGGLVITLYETTPSSRIFRSIIPHVGFGPSTIPGDTVIGVTPGERVFARYLDLSSGQEKIATTEWHVETLQIEFQMPATHFGEGDLFWCDLNYSNQGETVQVDLYILLDVYGDFFCYPAWQSINDGLPFERMTIAEGEEDVITVLPAFVMPAVSPMGPFYFYAAMFSAGELSVDSLVSGVGIAEFYFD